MLPELWADEADRQTPNLFFFAVLRFTRDAHRRDDRDALDRAYGFADWCRQQGGELENAAYVAFYEHLFDAWDVHAHVMRRLDANLMRSCWPLWEVRLEPDRVSRSPGLLL